VTPDIAVSEPGLYTLTATAANGCMTIVDELIIENTVAPQITIDSVGIDCQSNTAYLSVAVADPFAEIAWFESGVLVDSAVAIAPAVPGEYIVIVTGSNQCFSSDTVDFPGFARPAFSVSGGTLTCVIDSVALIASSTDPEVQFEWYDSSGVYSTASTYVAGAPGDYSVRAVVENGCPGDTTLVVPIDTIDPIAVIIAPADMICGASDIVTVDGSSSLGDDLAFQWSTINGEIISGASMADPSVRGLGTYYLSLTDGVNGCTSRDSVTLSPISQLSGIVASAVPECSGNAMGSITITDVAGANSPLQFRIAATPFDTVTMFDGLSAGDYLITVRDSFGCTVDTMIT
ncbi:MAG: hypothetical protein R3330_19575, partial [Saprospiraceae bacterium]|nr:hypothetical protein [Saprospiraceae bacterium]